MPPPESPGDASASPPDRPLSPAFRIIVVKWDTLTADLLGRLAQEACPGAEVIVCRTGADTLDTLRRRPAGLGLFGLTLPDIDGLDLLALVADEHLVQRRLIVTGRRDEHSRRRLRVARVQGVFDTSSEDSAALLTAIEKVAAGEHYFSASLGSASPVAPPREPVKVQTLTFIEQQVFAIMIESATDAEIGKRLRMETPAVEAHRANILRKLNVQTVEQLPAFIRRSSRWK